INQERDNNIIGSYNEVEFYFHKNKLNMWVVKIEEEMFFYAQKKYHLNKLTLKQFLDILFFLEIEWEFYQKLCFLDQICIKLENNNLFLFCFDTDCRKGKLLKISGALTSNPQ
ncbi:hypothetical protein V2605_10720, partial [Tenacibaculum maritimum]